MELPADTYLRDKLFNIATSHKRMSLQIQVRNIEAGNPDVCNPRIPWSETDYPWQDLADLVLTYYVPKVSEDRAHFNFTKLPDDIRYETPVGTDNYGGLIQIQEKVLTSTVRKKYPEGTSTESKKTTTFLVHVETGNHLFSGTDAGVYITLYGKLLFCTLKKIITFKHVLVHYVRVHCTQKTFLCFRAYFRPWYKKSIWNNILIDLSAEALVLSD